MGWRCSCITPKFKLDLVLGYVNITLKLLSNKEILANSESTNRRGALICCVQRFLTAHECTLRACPCGDLPSAAWTALQQGPRDMESLPVWRSPTAVPQMTSCRQNHTGMSIFSAWLKVFLTFHSIPFLRKVTRRDTHTSLWCVYIRSNRASGAIHLTGKRPWGEGMQVKAIYSARLFPPQRMQSSIILYCLIRTVWYHAGRIVQIETATVSWKWLQVTGSSIRSSTCHRASACINAFAIQKPNMFSYR